MFVCIVSVTYIVLTSLRVDRLFLRLLVEYIVPDSGLFYKPHFNLFYFTQAYKIGLYGPKIVWIFYNWLTYDFWRPRNDVSCTADEMKEAIEGAFLMGSFVRNHIEERGIAGITGKLGFIFMNFVLLLNVKNSLIPSMSK